MILCTENPTENLMHRKPHRKTQRLHIKKLLEQVKSVKLQDTKPEYKNQLHFYALTTKYPNKKWRKQYITLVEKIIKYLEVN